MRITQAASDPSRHPVVVGGDGAPLRLEYLSDADIEQRVNAGYTLRTVSFVPEHEADAAQALTGGRYLHRGAIETRAAVHIVDLLRRAQQ